MICDWSAGGGKVFVELALIVLLCSSEGSKSSKKNAKRSAARAKKRLLQDTDKADGSDQEYGAAAPTAVAMRPKPVDRLEALKQEMEEAKSRKVGLISICVLDSGGKLLAGFPFDTVPVWLFFGER